MSFDTWQALLHLEFKADSLGKTVLSRNLHQGPLMVQKPFYNILGVLSGKEFFVSN